MFLVCSLDRECVLRIVKMLLMIVVLKVVMGCVIVIIGFIRFYVRMIELSDDLGVVMRND